jgi:hypothetical protein
MSFFYEIPITDDSVLKRSGGFPTVDAAKVAARIALFIRLPGKEHKESGRVFKMSFRSKLVLEQIDSVFPVREEGRKP